MLNCGRWIVAAFALGSCVPDAGAQTSAQETAVETNATADDRNDAAPIRSAVAARYFILQEQEQRVVSSQAATAEDFRVVINRYWSFVRRYPSSGYADNALWQAGSLSELAFQRFGIDRDNHRAAQLFRWLTDQYPHSSLKLKALEHIQQLALVAPAITSTESTIRSVYREVLPEVVRVTIELDQEVPFSQERIGAPSRLFFDVKSTKTISALVDATLRYDSDVVRHIRLGRHPNNTTRIVLDFENVARYSVFTLYNPYRIVIDAERTNTTLAAAKDTETSGTRSVTPPAPRSTAKPPAAKPAMPVTASKPITLIARHAPSVAIVPIAPVVLVARVAPVAPAVAPVAPIAPPAPIAPKANSSGKYSVARQLGLGVSRIVIDAGHGGHDPGASAHSSSESEIVLDVALRLEKLLLAEPGMEVVLTRRSDDYVSLEERTEIANKESADLFLSIHANASANATARGVETYFLNFALNPQAEAVAARENAASGKTMNSLPGIVKAIAMNSKLNESRDFAASVQRALVRGLRPGNKTLKDLGVKQAPFMVLVGASMPSVLAEISFVTNRQESRLLKTPAYRQRIAEALLAGILQYQQSLKKIQTTAQK